MLPSDWEVFTDQMLRFVFPEPMSISTFLLISRTRVNCHQLSFFWLPFLNVLYFCCKCACNYLKRKGNDVTTIYKSIQGTFRVVLNLRLNRLTQRKFGCYKLILEESNDSEFSTKSRVSKI